MCRHGAYSDRSVEKLLAKHKSIVELLFFVFFGSFIAFVNELICKTIHSGGKLVKFSHVKRKVPLGEMN